MSRAGPGAVMSLGNMSTHISILPWEQTWGQSERRGRPSLESESTYLLNARFVGVEQRPGLHVFRDQFALDPWDLVPVLQHGQSQMFVRLLLQT